MIQSFKLFNSVDDYDKSGFGGGYSSGALSGSVDCSDSRSNGSGYGRGSASGAGTILRFGSGPLPFEDDHTGFGTCLFTGHG